MKLHNIQYQLISTDRATGAFSVRVDAESLKKFDEELVVQDFEDEQTSILELRMAVQNYLKFLVKFNGEELKTFEEEDKLGAFMEEICEMNPLLEELITIEEISADRYVFPPAHQIRQQIYESLAISVSQGYLDERGLTDQVYDGYIPDGCSSDGKPLF